MPNYHTVNAFLSVRNADALIVAYREVLKATLLSRDPASGTVQRAELQVGDSIIAITEVLPQSNYLMSITDDVEGLRKTIQNAGPGWTVTDPQHHGDFLVIHATDPAGVTWIIQQELSGVSNANPEQLADFRSPPLRYDSTKEQGGTE